MNGLDGAYTHVWQHFVPVYMCQLALLAGREEDWWVLRPIRVARSLEQTYNLRIVEAMLAEKFRYLRVLSEDAM